MLGTTPSQRRGLLIIAYLGFIGLGLPDGLLGVAWPGVREDFALAQGWLGTVLVASGIGYALTSFYAGTLVRYLGVGGLLAGSSLLMVTALFGYGLSPNWWIFSSWGLAAGMGAGAIDAGLNLYAANHFSARHMNWLHAAWGIGAMLGPLAISTALSQGLSWRWGYLSLGGLLLLLALLFVVSRRAWQTPAPDHGEALGAIQVLRHPLVQLHVALFFVYTGVEAVAGQWAYTLLTEGRGMDPVTGGHWLAGYWAALALGRVGFGLLSDHLDLDWLLRRALLGGLAASLLVELGSPNVAGLGLVLLGLTIAPVFPVLMTRTPARLGAERAVHAVGFQVTAAMVGAVILPALTGLLVTGIGLQAVAIVLVVAALTLVLGHERLLHQDLTARQSDPRSG